MTSLQFNETDSRKVSPHLLGSSNATDSSNPHINPLHSSSFGAYNSGMANIVSGLWIIMITFLSSFIEKSFRGIISMFTDTVCTSVTITNHDQPYEWLMSYLPQEYFENIDDRKNVKVNLKLDDLELLRHSVSGVEESLMINDGGQKDSLDEVLGKISRESSSESLEKTLDLERGNSSESSDGEQALSGFTHSSSGHSLDSMDTSSKGSSSSSNSSSKALRTSSTENSKNLSHSIENLIEKELGDGTHWIKYKNKHWMHIHVSSADKLTTRGWNNEPFQMQTITITMYGKSSNTEAILTEFIEEAKTYYTEKKFEQSAKIYLVSKWGGWMRCGKNKAKRRLDSVILDKNQAEFLLKDAKTFLSQKKWYMDHGIPYRRGYCIYGPPGSGKSSFVVALASELSLGICVLTLSSNNLDDQSLNELLHNTPSKCIILLEDVDAVFVAREATDIMDSNRITFSGLLNALDGVAAQENKLFFMTTNHIDKLDPALLRPGRCDVKIRFDYASKQQIKDMWIRFNPQSRGDLMQNFVDSIPEFTVSCSSLQEHFLKYELPEDAVNNFHDLLRDPKREREDIDAEEAWKLSTSGRDIGTWLLRLGIPQYTETFRSQGFYTLEDVRDIETEVISTKHDEIPEGHISRIEGMLQGDEHIKANFQIAPRSRVIELFEQHYNQPPSEKFIEKVADKVTSFQLLEFFQSATREFAEENVNALVNPKTSWEISEEEKNSLYKTRSIAEFLSTIPLLTSEDINKLEQNLKNESIFTTDDLVDLDDSLYENDLKEKGKIIQMRLSLDKLKEEQESLENEIENRKINSKS